MAEARTASPKAFAPSTRRSFGAEHDYFAVDFTRVRAAIHGGDPRALTMIDRLGSRLRRHMRVEELLLLAPLEERLDASARSFTAVIRREHQHLDGAIDAARIAMGAGVGAGARELDALDTAFREHEVMEERLFFPLCDDVLSPEQRAAAVRELDRKISGPTTLPGGEP